MEGVEVMKVVVSVTGHASSGKSTVLNVIRRALLNAGYEVSGASFTFGRTNDADKESVTVSRGSSTPYSTGKSP